MSATPPPIRKPGIDVVQSVRTEEVQIVQPVLQPVIVGACFKVLEVTNSDSSLNTSARMSLPAIYQPFMDKSGMALGGALVLAAPETVTFVVNEGPPLAIVIPIGNYTMATIAAYIQEKADLAGSPIAAEVVAVSSVNGFIRTRTKGVGDGASLEVSWSGGTVITSTVKLPRSWKAVGSSQYTNERWFVTKDLLPDPWNLGEDLDILESTVRAFLTTSTVVKKEQFRTQAVSRAGNSPLKINDDGDGDGTSPLLQFDDTAATRYPADIRQTVPVDDYRLVRFALAPTQASVTTDVGVVWPLVADATFTLQIDGWHEQTIFLPAGTSLAAAETIIEGYFPGVVTTAAQLTITSPTYGRESVIKVSGTDAATLFGVGTYPMVYRGIAQEVAVGDEVWVDGSLFGVVSQLISTPVGVGLGNHQVVKLDREYAIDYFGAGAAPKDWYIVSKGLTAQIEAAGVADRATPELYVDSYVVQFKHEALRGYKGDPMYPPMTPSLVKAYEGMYYKGLRLDVTVSARTRNPEPVVIRGNDFVQLDTEMAPLDTQNPVGLGMYFALLNSGDVPILGFGVDEVSDEYPEGTPDAYARAFDALRSYRVYAMASMTFDFDVAQYLYAHVKYMSATKRKGERFGFVTCEIPDRDEPTVVGSNTAGNAAAGGSPRNFETGLADLAELFVEAGVTGAGGWGTDTGVYLNIEGDANNYLVTGYSGATIVCREIVPGEDTFFSAALWPAAIIDKSFTIYVRGDLLEDTAGNPDRTKQAIAIGKRAARFNDRRMCLGAPGEVEAVINGLDTIIPSYYLAAGQIGLRCGVTPSRPLTNSAIQGFTKVRRSNGYFNDEDMDQAAGYGVWWWENDETTGTVKTRHQLSTDPTSIKTQENSILVAMDFGAYAIRDSLRAMIGTMNITPTTMDMLSTNLNGVLDFLVDSGVWLSADLVRLVQGPFEATPEDLAEGLGPGKEDEVLAEVEATIGSPLNRVRIRIVV